MVELTLGSALRRTAQRHGSVVAIVGDSKRYTYGELDQLADRFACGLLEIGVGKGDHVGLWMSTKPEWIIAFCACARIGAVAVPINTRYRADEAEYIIGQADMKVLICERQMWQNDSYQMLISMCPGLAKQTSGMLALDLFPSLRTIIMDGDQTSPGTMAYRSVLNTSVNDELIGAAQRLVREIDPLLICFTSGSTGKPKGVVHSHRTLRHSRVIAQNLHIEAGDSHLANWPMYHVAGLFIVLVPAILCAATMVLFPHWDGDDALNLIERERISLIGGISTHYLDMVDAMKRRQRDTSSIKVAYIGGATLPGDSFTNIMRTLGLKRLLSTYGMTENTVSTTFNSWDDPVDICRQNKAPVITSGKVKIMDLSTFEAVPTGTEGEIWCSGPTVMLGYYKNPGQTRQVLTEDGWLRTGDLGRFDSNGYLEVTGRLKDIIKVGGTNVSPTEVEGLIMANPAIQFAVVVGVPDVRLGEVPYAYAKITGDRSLSEKEIIEFCRSKMAQFKIPHYVKIVTDFPRLSTGKIDRVQLSKMAVADLSAQEPA